MQVKEPKLAKINAHGVVQGVGFRPFVYRLAREHNLKGWVRNTSGSVEIEVEGTGESIDSFLLDLEVKAPIVSRIERLSATFHPPQGYQTFEIGESKSQEGRYQLVSPDIATCDDCLREILDPADRRFGYPFTNCTNCGPRFTIIKDIPYDRPLTTMGKFRMCLQCRQEYDDPADRRFHAQPNACPRCGPSLELTDDNGYIVDKVDPVKTAGNLLRSGKILALRGLGGFQLACDATSEEAVSLLRKRKRRPAKPLAVMVSNIETAEKHCHVSPEEGRLLQSAACPIVLLRWEHSFSDISRAVAPSLSYLGVMLPYTPLHHLLLREVGGPLVMTSGNLSEEPIAKDNDEALRRLGGIADYFLLHDRDIHVRYDDSVCMVTDGTPQVLRRARGYAPYPVALPFRSRQVLACGAELKNTFCLARDEHAFLSQHIGDMDNEETLEHFENTVALYTALFRLQPELVACDMHPDYLSTKYAVNYGRSQDIRVVPVQHHHAHIVSCMVDNEIDSPVIGVAFDGTGYGSDGTIWGGEFLIADYHGFKRAGHLECVPLPGGEAAIKKPYRMALSYLYTLLGHDYSLEGLPLSNINATELDIIKKQLRRGINSPLTSSAGRLFDGVSALAGVRAEIAYEAQAAVEMEMLATDKLGEPAPNTYPFNIIEHEGSHIVKLGELFAAVADDIRNKTSVDIISFRFHSTVARIICDMCQFIAKDSKITEVALSGGVFQNRLLQSLATAALRREGFRVLMHRSVPCGDGGISLGQAVIASSADI